MKSTFNPSSTAARTLKEIIEDGKVTISMAIEGLEDEDLYRFLRDKMEAKPKTEPRKP